MPQANLSYFSQIKQKFSKIMNFTGAGRDCQQFQALVESLNGRKGHASFLFIGCSTGEEIIDCQNLIKKHMPGLQAFFYGYDVDEKTVKIAANKAYHYPTTIQCKDVIEKGITQRFDTIICRNMLIYYDNEKVNKALKIMANACDHVLMIGTSDPLTFAIHEDKAEIHDNVFIVKDFDNRIFQRDKQNQ